MPASKTETGSSRPRAWCPALDRYRDAIWNLPRSGGDGCHVGLLRVANLGRMAGVSREQIAQDLAAHVHGTRRVPPSEIEAAVAKAFSSAPSCVIARLPVDGERLLKFIMKRGADFTEADLWDVSPVRIDWPPSRDPVEVLRRLYEPEERLFIGSRYDAGPEHVRPASEWIERFESGAAVPEHIIPNPLSGELGETKNGKRSYRADSCVERFRFAVVEFDTMSREQQIHFWAGVKLPIVALVDSARRSVHGWIRIDAANAGEWTGRVEDKLFTLLTAVGADAACKNEARLSRMPGGLRAETGRWQRLLYLSPAGGPVLP
ncbi:MAG TPA: hypothetical protein VOA88_05045 [Candidatus Dormibacteraeota bacterium]|nr:hypothetical protein [Candidatus Dormibacteraeota bacterium]